MTAALFEYVQRRYAESDIPYIREWFFDGHVKVVADYVREIAAREGIDPKIPLIAGLFHDIARVDGIDDDPDLMNASLRETEAVLRQKGYPADVITQILGIIEGHSCRKTVPASPKGKVMVTADALAHMMTDFYFVLPFNGWLTAADTVEGWKRWVAEKVERDFTKKILFPADKTRARPRYEAFKVLMQNDE
jgi:HD superfamily phosphodiesterase